MIKTRGKIVTISIIIFTLFIGFIGFSFYGEINGFPWLKQKAHEKIEKYLKDNFTTNVAIKTLNYNIKTKDYFARIYAENYNFEFQCEIIKNEISCDFFANYWEFQIKNELENKLESICGNDINISPRIYPTPKLRNIYQPLFDKLPNYGDIKKDIQGNGNSLYIQFPYEFTLENENEKLYQIFIIINEIFDFTSIHFHFSNVSYLLDNKYYQFIYNSDDIKKYLNIGNQSEAQK